MVPCGGRCRVYVGAGGWQWSWRCRRQGCLVPEHDQAITMTVRWGDDHSLLVGDGHHGAQPQANGVQRRQRGGDGPQSAQAISRGLREG